LLNLLLGFNIRETYIAPNHYFHRWDMHKPRVAVIGYGYAGRCFHAYLVGLADGLDLYAIATSRTEARLQIERDLGVKTFFRFEEVLEDPQVDLVVLATPNHLHAPQAIQALEAGKHVVTDKPMCLDLGEADAMIAAAHEHGRLLSVFQNRRWDGDFLTVKKILEKGVLGRPCLIEVFWGQYGRPRGWRSQKEKGGGKFMDLGAHLIDQVLQLVPAPLKQVYARFSYPNKWDNDVEDHALALLSFANGVEARIETSSLARKPKPRWYVLGTEGALLKEGLDPQERAMVARDIDSAREVPENRARLYLEVAGQQAESLVETVPGRWRSYYENIAAALKGEEELAVTPQSVRAVMAVLEACRSSAAQGRTVRLQEGTSP
jgi:scyllo-inositol 2-dehydrogenase (NADP+)